MEFKKLAGNFGKTYGIDFIKLLDMVLTKHQQSMLSNMGLLERNR